LLTARRSKEGPQHVEIHVIALERRPRDLVRPPRPRVGQFDGRGQEVTPQGPGRPDDIQPTDRWPPQVVQVHGDRNKSISTAAFEVNRGDVFDVDLEIAQVPTRRVDTAWCTEQPQRVIQLVTLRAYRPATEGPRCGIR